MPRDPGPERPKAVASEAVASPAVGSSEAVAVVEAVEVIVQRCADELPHGPHEVPAAGTQTAFTCPGPLAFERLLAEAFGAVMSRGPN